ncbi:MAG: ABC transporter permease [Ectothiorhodospiraceae bacterium]|nr:ABC transporter permease [Chromatiales bacterium]MCP5155411.1 ABC transporter permease [Ectothiorhodospiraceae bacterium]
MSAALEPEVGAATAEEPATGSRAWRFVRRNPTIVVGGLILALVLGAALAAPLLAPIDPLEINVLVRLQGPSAEHPFGTDHLGRDIWSRTVHGGKVSLLVGASVAVISSALGLFIGLVAGYITIVDRIVMRIMDGLMSIPSILLAIALMALAGSSIGNVIFAITVSEVPRVTRLVRGIVLSVREEPFIEAAVASGTRTFWIIVRHILPMTVAPLIVQATYVSAAAIISEAYLSFLGAGTPPEVPSWGNVVAEGRDFFPIAPWLILVPSAFLAMTVLAVNMLGDGLRDTLDPRIARRM